MVKKKQVNVAKCLIWRGMDCKWYFLTKTSGVFCAQKYTKRSNAVRAAKRFCVKIAHECVFIPII
jgi:hypothetical protein